MTSSEETVCFRTMLPITTSNHRGAGTCGKQAGLPVSGRSSNGQSFLLFSSDAGSSPAVPMRRKPMTARKDGHPSHDLNPERNTPAPRRQTWVRDQLSSVVRALGPGSESRSWSSGFAAVATQSSGFVHRVSRNHEPRQYVQGGQNNFAVEASPAPTYSRNIVQWQDRAVFFPRLLSGSDAGSIPAVPIGGMGTPPAARFLFFIIDFLLNMPRGAETAGHVRA